MASVLPSRLATLSKLRCSIFQTAYNPLSIRTGAKYLRARLRGPSMLNYYPEVLTIAKIRKEYPDFDVDDQAELERLADIEDRKSRGKGTPRKARSKGASILVSLHRCRLNRSFSRRVP
jgi:small subunit ribosomal protein S33